MVWNFCDFLNPWMSKRMRARAACREQPVRGKKHPVRLATGVQSKNTMLPEARLLQKPRDFYWASACAVALAMHAALQPSVPWTTRPWKNDHVLIYNLYTMNIYHVHTPHKYHTSLWWCIWWWMYYGWCIMHTPYKYHTSLWWCIDVGRCWMMYYGWGIMMMYYTDLITTHIWLRLIKQSLFV